MRSRSAFAASMMLLGFGIAALTLTAARVPRVYYLPVEGAWSWSAPGGSISMHWFWVAGLTELAAVTSWACGWLVAARMSERARVRGFTLVMGVAMLVIAWAAAFSIVAFAAAPRDASGTTQVRRTR